MTERTNVAFIGLGVMGAPMAGHLAKAGYNVTVYNRTRSRADVFCGRPGKMSACVGNDDDLAEVLLGTDGALGAMPRGALLVDHTTVSADMARKIDHEARVLGLEAIDAPVSGGQAGAENGALAIMCGGSEAAMARATPVMDCYAARIVHVGGAGAGQTAKMANQMCIAGVLGGLSEAIRLAQAAGLDLDKTYDAISGGAAQSWQMNNRWQTCCSF